MADLRVITVGSILEETPEGFHHMEQLRRADEEWCYLLTPAARERVAEAERAAERHFLGV